MWIPKRRKYKSVPHRISYEGKAKGNKEVSWGEYGLQALKGAWITSKQLEAARRVISKYTKKSGKMKSNIFAHMPKSKKPLEVRMGGGKGSIEDWVAVVKVGTVMFEVSELPQTAAYKSLKSAAYKLPIKCRVVERTKPHPTS